LISNGIFLYAPAIFFIFFARFECRLLPNRMDFICGAIGGGVAEACVMPLCTMMTFVATNPKDHLNWKTTWTRFKARQPHHKVTLSSWFPSAHWQIGTQMGSTSTKFGFYELLKSVFPDQSKYLLGTLSTLCAISLTHPLDTIKINRQLSSPKTRFTPKELYKGFLPAVTKGMVGGVTFFPLRDTFLERNWSEGKSNTASALLSTTAMHGFDMAKRRAQAQHTPLRISDVGQYFKGPGLVFNYVRVGFHFNIQMMVVERVRKVLRPSPSNK
jgi:hypothetical protein